MNKDFNFTLKPGNYWVGDTCYVYPRDKWQDFIDGEYFKSNDAGFVTEYEGVEFFVYNTGGDGYFPLFKGKKELGGMGVDAGMLSVIPESLVKLWNDENGIKLGIFVEIKKDTQLIYSDEGFMFGRFLVPMAGSIGYELRKFVSKSK